MVGDDAAERQKATPEVTAVQLPIYKERDAPATVNVPEAMLCRRPRGALPPDEPPEPPACGLATSLCTAPRRPCSR